MVPLAIVRQFASGQQIGVDVADQEIVLHYVLELLNETGLTGSRDRGAPGPLLFKGGTALRKCVFGQTGRFSQDIDMDAAHRNGFEADIEAVFNAHSPFNGSTRSCPRSICRSWTSPTSSTSSSLPLSSTASIPTR